jgi:hypothetical protein
VFTVAEVFAIANHFFSIMCIYPRDDDALVEYPRDEVAAVEIKGAAAA